ncbi:hypothetical protein [Aeromicrobium sp.]|uniref:hypothetical protein n=1 Tax=Aeromicrobium sp. TaxID=1871063 RepID=UPI003D6AAE2E
MIGGNGVVEVRRRRTVDVVVLVLLMVVAGIACFVTSVVWLADFDVSDPNTGIAGFSSTVLAITIVAALAATAGRRSARAGSITLLIGLVLAAVVWVGAL